MHWAVGGVWVPKLLLLQRANALCPNVGVCGAEGCGESLCAVLGKLGPGVQRGAEVPM